jgi:hypothetical protein
MPHGHPARLLSLRSMQEPVVVLASACCFSTTTWPKAELLQVAAVLPLSMFVIDQRAYDKLHKKHWNLRYLLHESRCARVTYQGPPCRGQHIKSPDTDFNESSVMHPIEMCNLKIWTLACY